VDHLNLDLVPIYVLDIDFFLEQWGPKQEEIEKKLVEINPVKDEKEEE